jgi:DNA replication protein DnaC
MKEFQPCRKCFHKPNERIPIGFYESILEKNGHEYKVLVECDHHKEWQQEYATFLQFKENGFDAKTWEFQFTDYKGEKSKSNLNRLENYINNFNQLDVKASVLYFSGNHNTQKTTIANIIGRKLLLKNNDVQYVTMNDFKDSFWAYATARDRNTKQEQENDYLKIRTFEKLRDCDLLIIDDAFTISLFPGGLVDIDNFIRSRIKNSKGIIFVSNYDAEKLSSIKTCSPSIASFIERETKKRNSVFVFKDDRNDIPTELF